MEKKHLRVYFSWCDIHFDTFADQAMAEFVFSS